MPTLIVDPVLLTATADVFGAAVATGYKRKHTHASVFNSTGGTIVLKMYLCPANAAASTTNQICEVSLETKDTYLCPEFVGSELAATGTMRALGNGLSFKYNAEDSLI